MCEAQNELQGTYQKIKFKRQKFQMYIGDIKKQKTNYQDVKIWDKIKTKHNGQKNKTKTITEQRTKSQKQNEIT